MSKKYKLLSFNELGDDRGHLVVAEGNGKDVPFEINRIFYMYGTVDDVSRGNHANRDSQFVLINLQGSCVVDVDDGFHKESFKLDRPHHGLYLDRLVWKSMHSFSSDSVLLVISSEHYNSDEYINDYESFLNIARNGE